MSTSTSWSRCIVGGTVKVLCDLVQQRLPLPHALVRWHGYPAARRQQRHLVRVDEEQVIRSQLGFSHRPVERPPQPRLSRRRQR